MQGQFTRSWNGSEQAPPGSVRPRFYLDPVQDELASAREGRPIFKEVERVEIFMPGNPYAIPVFNVTDQHRERWPREYEQFREGIEQTAEGTPIAEWPILNRAQVLELKALQLQTVEEVAALSDLACQRAMGLNQLRTKAQAYLDDAAAMALTEQLSKQNEDQRSEIASLTRQVEELGSLVTKLHGEVMGMRNAPNPIASAIPGMADPFQQMAMQQAGTDNREPATSSLGAFVEQERVRKGWPKGKPRGPRTPLPSSSDEAA
jgi:hypothetical protein